MVLDYVKSAKGLTNTNGAIIIIIFLKGSFASV